jgi:hypothetical protein
MALLAQQHGSEEFFDRNPGDVSPSGACVTKSNTLDAVR